VLEHVGMVAGVEGVSVGEHEFVGLAGRARGGPAPREALIQREL
jgi:hypothetical protein